MRVRTPVSQTGYSHPRCYRRHTKDCSPGISGEHPISRNVLKELSTPTVLVDGVPWLAVGERREMPITALESNILCARHNAAFSDLDAEAGLFVKKIKEIRTTNGEFLSQKSSLTIFSGEALEIWALKVAFGLFYAKYAAQNRQHLLARHTIDHSLMDQALRAEWQPHCGLYLFGAFGAEMVGGNSISVQPGMTNDNRFVAIQILVVGLHLMLIFDPHGVSDSNLLSRAGWFFRPTDLSFRIGEHQHWIVLTWPSGERFVAVEFTAV